MNNKLSKLFFVFFILILSVGIVAAADVDCNASNDELAISDINDGLSQDIYVDDNESLETSESTENVDVLGVNAEDTLESNDNSCDNNLKLSDENTLSDEDYNYLVEGDYKGGTTDNGFTVYCADEELDPPSASSKTPMYMDDVGKLYNTFYNEPVGEYLKILIYSYMDEIHEMGTVKFCTKITDSGKLKITTVKPDSLFQHFVWALTDSSFRNPPYDGEIIIEYDGGEHDNVFKHTRSLTHEELLEAGMQYPELYDDDEFLYYLNEGVTHYDLIMSVINKVVRDYDDGIRIPDHATKELEDGTILNYEFTSFLTDETHQNLIAYKITESASLSASLDVHKISLNKTVYVNNNTEFLIIVENTGEVDLTKIFVKEDKFEGLTYQTYIDKTGKWKFDDKDTWEYQDTLAPGESANFTVVFKATKAGNFTNYAIAGSDETDNVTANNNTTVYKADLKVEKTTQTPEVVAGDEVIFTINVTNTGNCDLSDIIVIENPPETFIFNGISDGDFRQEDEKTFVYDGVLTPGQSVTFDIKYLTTVNGTFENSVTVTSNETEDDNTTSKRKIKALGPRLSASKIATLHEVEIGQEVVYIINVTNIGDCDIGEVKVVEEAPSELEYQSMYGDGWKTEDGITFTYDGVLAPGESKVFNVVYLTSVSGTFKNVIYVYSNLTSEEEKEEETITVTQPGLRVEKVADRNNVSVGDEIRFTITVYNTGNCDLTDVVVEENIPSGLTYTGYENGTGKWSADNGKFILTTSLKDGCNVTLIVKVTASQSGSFINSVIAKSNQTDNQTANDTVSVNEKSSSESNSTEESEAIEVSDEDSATVNSNISESYADNDSSKSLAAVDKKATGNPILLLLVVFSLIGFSNYRKNKK